MTKTIRLTMAQALCRFLTRQTTEIDGRTVPVFGGVWAIFGHGNVAGLGEALYGVSATARSRPTTCSVPFRAISTASRGPSRSFRHSRVPCRC